MPTSQEALREIYRRKVLNQELSLQEFSRKDIILQSRPTKAIVELTENCNFRCVMCAQAFDPKYARYSPDYNMPLALFEKVARELFNDAYFVDLRGFGETVILPHWPEILDRLEDYPLVNWHLVTNLSVPRDAIWERMVDAGFMLGFSCDAATQKTFESIRVRSHFKTILHNLKLVTDRIESLRKGHVYFIVTVQKRNIPELPAIVELAGEHSVREVQFKMVRQFDGELNHAEMIEDSQRGELREAVERSLDLALERGVNLSLNDHELRVGIDPRKISQAAAIRIPEERNFPPPYEFDPEFNQEHPWTSTAAKVLDTIRVSVHQTCFKPYHYTYVGRDGRVGTCNHMMNPDILSMGNLNYQDFEEIWNGYEYQVFRRSLVYASPIDPRCEWCFAHRLED